VADRVEVREGDLTAPLGDDVFDVIVTNLPYVAEHERTRLPVHIRDHEPGLALFAGEDGLDLYRRLVPAVARNLCSGGLLVMEHGEEQGASVGALFDRALWQDPTLERDLAKLDRFTWSIRR
jgi:release factor glutamine methyltransferase